MPLMTNTTAAQIARKLSPAMRAALLAGHTDQHARGQAASGRTGTLAALVTRELVYPGAGSSLAWTPLGREVARELDPTVQTLEEVHAEALGIDAEITALRAELKGTAPGVRWADGVPCDHAAKRRDCEWCNPRTISDLIDEARREELTCTTCRRAVRIGSSGPEHVEPPVHVNGIHVPTLPRPQVLIDHDRKTVHIIHADGTVDRPEYDAYLAGPVRDPEVSGRCDRPRLAFCRTGQHSCTPAVTLTFDGGSRRLHWCGEHAGDADAYRPDSDEAAREIMTRADLRAWLLARGVAERDVELYVGQNYGRTEDEMNDMYEASHGSMA